MSNTISRFAVSSISFFALFRGLDVPSAVKLGSRARLLFFHGAFGRGFRGPVVDGEMVGCVDYTAAKGYDLAFVVVLHATTRALFFGGGAGDGGPRGAGVVHVETVGVEGYAGHAALAWVFHWGWAWRDGLACWHASDWASGHAVIDGVW